MLILKSSKKRSFKTFDSFIKKNKGYIVASKQFIEWTLKEDNSLDLIEDEINQDWLYIENRILAEIANSFWDKNDYYHILLNEDNQFSTALENMDKAKLLVD